MHLYIIRSGKCNLVCRKAQDKFKQLEHEDDPTQIRRDIERLRRKNPFKHRESLKDKYMLRYERGAVPPEDQFGTIHQNGYISNTLKSIHVGQKSDLEWIGEEILLMEDPAKEHFNYSVIAHTKVETFMLHSKEQKKIPLSLKNQLRDIA